MYLRIAGYQSIRFKQKYVFAYSWLLVYPVQLEICICVQLATSLSGSTRNMYLRIAGLSGTTRNMYLHIAGYQSIRYNQKYVFAYSWLLVYPVQLEICICVQLATSLFSTTRDMYIRIVGHQSVPYIQKCVSAQLVRQILRS